MKYKKLSEIMEALKDKPDRVEVNTSWGHFKKLIEQAETEGFKEAWDALTSDIFDTIDELIDQESLKEKSEKKQLGKLYDHNSYASGNSEGFIYGLERLKEIIKEELKLTIKESN